MRRCSRAFVAVLAAIGAALGGASTADANFVATAADPAGDATDPSPGRDITAVGLSYDRRSGELIGAIRLRGEPGEQPAFVSMFAGTRTATGCNGYPAAGFGSFSDEFGASWLRLDDAAGNGPRGEADKIGFKSDIQQFEASDPQLAGQPLDCFIATLTEPGNAAHAYDVVGPIALAGQPALALQIGRVPRAIRPGRSRKVKLTLTNAGDAPTSRIRLKVRRARGLKVKGGSRSLKPIAPGQRRTVTMTVTLGRRARAATDLKVTAKAGELLARAEATLHVLRPGKPGDGNGGNGSSRSCVRYQADLSGETGGSLILVPC